MSLRRRTRLTSAPLAVAAVLSGLGLIACEGDQFETDSSTVSATGSETSGSAPVSSATADDTHEPALPPNTPPVEPIFGGPPPNDTEANSEDTTGAALTSAESGEQTSAPETFPGETTGSEVTSEDATAEPDDTGSSEEISATEHCAPVADWDPAWSQWEEEVLQLVNDVRAVGANCDTEGEFGPAEPLSMDPMLRCSSRLHSLDMFERDYFDHTNPDGLDPFDRMELAGFSGSYMGENIAYGQPSPEEVMQAWVDSDGHCSNIMNPNYTLLGVGYYPGADSWRDGNQHFWTQNFGAPMRQGGFGGGGGGGGGFGQ